ncbi:MAG: hypothetical protein V3T77_10740, partial [Planctomycetota bacterium]
MTLQGSPRFIAVPLALVLWVAGSCWAQQAPISHPGHASSAHSGKHSPGNPDQRLGLQSSKLAAGKVPLLDMLKYLQAATGKIVLYPSAMRDGSFDEKIMINMLGEVNPLTPEIVVTILEANGYRFYEDEAA